MFEKVNPMHPDKMADVIAGAIVDRAYAIMDNPTVAVEVLIGHDHCHVIIETTSPLDEQSVIEIIHRIAGPDVQPDVQIVPQDVRLAKNQYEGIRCGDNGIFKGVPVTEEQKELACIAELIYEKYPYDGKYILNGGHLTICQSNAPTEGLRDIFPDAIVNPLGDWTGGPSCDAGATNRKLGSDMGDSVTGGGLHGKDLSKADVSVNIYAFIKAQALGHTVQLSCSIGDEVVDGRPYAEIVEIARGYIGQLGGFENFARWGLISSEALSFCVKLVSDDGHSF